MPGLNVKRAYEPASKGDGFRILVDRLWPRGIKKENARIDAWRKDVAPSDALRRWFGHDAEKWSEFKRRYAEELSRPAAREGIEYIRGLAADKTVTLIYSASDEAHNNAVALSEFLAKHKAPKSPTRPSRARPRPAGQKARKRG